MGKKATEDNMVYCLWIPKAANPHYECVTLIAFPLQQLLHERASVLRFKYIARTHVSTYSNTQRARLEVLTVVLLNIRDFWDVIS